MLQCVSRYTATRLVTGAIDYRFNDGQRALVGGGESSTITSRVVLTAITAPPTMELGRRWRRAETLTRTAVWTHHVALEHRHCKTCPKQPDYVLTQFPKWGQ